MSDEDIKWKKFEPSEACEYNMEFIEWDKVPDAKQIKADIWELACSVFNDKNEFEKFWSKQELNWLSRNVTSQGLAIRILCGNFRPTRVKEMMQKWKSM